MTEGLLKFKDELDNEYTIWGLHDIHEWFKDNNPQMKDYDDLKYWLHNNTFDELIAVFIEYGEIEDYNIISYDIDRDKNILSKRIAYNIKKLSDIIGYEEMKKLVYNTVEFM